MSQEENKENVSSNENVTNSPEETSNPAEAAIDVSEQADSQEIDNLPIESIGSYARLEELLTDEEKEKTTNPTVQS
ncbi:MAG: hypothetical protein M3R11_07870 [Acidobacteriota bacterium]|nr:hypothetical protein [Acidobacteriota bacterium]